MFIVRLISNVIDCQEILYNDLLKDNEQLAMRNEQWALRSALSGRTDII
ncbi:MAG: hypothetical protein IKI11_07670 [Neisseriaceae bacterium]|nr:hypothetical protein [Neisseriaceae bacterium]